MDLNIKTEIEALAAKTKADIEAKLADVVTKGDLTELTEKATELETAMKAQGVTLAEMKVGFETKGQPMASFKDTLQKELKSIEEELITMKAKRGVPNIVLEVKAPHTMFVSDIVPAVAGAAPYMLTDFETGIARVPMRQPFLREIMNVKRTTKMFIAWAEQTNIQGDAGMVAEGGLKPLNSFDIVEKTTKVEKIAKMIKTSKENLDDIPEMMNLIQDELRRMVELKLDQQLYDGTGVSPELKGISRIIPAFSATGTPFAASIPNANYADVLMCAAAIVASHGYVANYALVNPMDLVFIQMYKTPDGQYVIPPFASANGTSVGGMRVIANPLIPVGSYIVGDFTKAHVRIREEFVIDIGLDGNDFSHNLVSIIGEMRAAFFIKTGEELAFVKGTFAAGLTAITKPPTP